MPATRDPSRSFDPDRHGGPAEGLSYLYVLACHGEDLLKVGFSRTPLQRWRSFHPRYYEVFDVDAAALVEVDTVREARRLERELAQRLIEHRAPPPLLVRAQAGGATEWYRGASAQVAGFLDRCAQEGHAVLRPPRDWLRRQLLQELPVVFGWGEALLVELGGQPERLDDPALRPLRDALLTRMGEYLTQLALPPHWLPQPLLDWEGQRFFPARSA